MSKSQQAAIPETEDLRVVSVSKAMEILSMSRATLYLMMKDKTLEYVKVRGARRIPLSAIRRLVRPAS